MNQFTHINDNIITDKRITFGSKTESRLSTRNNKSRNSSMNKSKSTSRIIDKTVFINNFNMETNKMFIQELL